MNHQTPITFLLSIIFLSACNIIKPQEQEAFIPAQPTNVSKAAAKTKGLAYYKGEGVKQDTRQAIYWLEAAALKGDLESQYYLSAIYHQDGPNQNCDKAFGYAQSVQTLATAKTTFLLAELYHAGCGTAVNYQKAIALYRSVQQDLPMAKVRIAGMYADARGVDYDSTSALQLLLEAYEDGEKIAQSRSCPIIQMQQAGKYTPGGETIMHQQTTHTYRGGDGSSLEQAVIILHADKKPIGPEAELTWLQSHYPDYQRISHHLVSGGKQTLFHEIQIEHGGESHAIYFNLTDWDNPFSATPDYWRDLTVHEQSDLNRTSNTAWTLTPDYTSLSSAAAMIADHKAAIAALQQQTEQGDALALYHLGVIYNVGQGVPKNIEKANHYFLQAAENDIVPAQYNIGLAMLAGNGIEQTQQEGIQWIEKAATGGDPSAQAYMFGSHIQGTVVEKDVEKAMAWLMKAAQAEHITSQFEIGRMYYTGNEIAKNEQKAHDWLLKAANNGHVSAMLITASMYMKGVGVQRDAEQALYWAAMTAKLAPTGKDIQVAGSIAQVVRPHLEQRKIAQIAVTVQQKVKALTEKTACQREFNRLLEIGV